MSIVISTGEAADIETYDGLKAFLVSHLELDSETETQLPSLIRMAEYRLNRMLTVPERETQSTITTVTDQAYVDLPDDYRQLRSAYIDSDYPLALVSYPHVLSMAENTGKPQVYTIATQAIHFGPTPDAEYSVVLTYMAKLSYLSATNQTNWLLSENADAYVYACLAQCELFLGHDARIPLLESALGETMAEVNRAGNRYRVASSFRLRSAVVV